MKLFSILSVLLFTITFQVVAQVNKYQDYTQIVGKVFDSVDNQAMNHVAIMVINKETNQLITGTTTNERGEYMLKLKDSGLYKVIYSYQTDIEYAIEYVYIEVDDYPKETIIKDIILKSIKQDVFSK